ncbi:MAG: hypothetical protein VCF24_27255 [Candidatus Latescibacterota bacterium]
MKIPLVLPLMVCAVVLPAAAQPVAADGDWRFHGHDAASTKSTSLD